MFIITINILKMEAFPNDFCLSTIEKKLQNNKVEEEFQQENMRAEFRMRLYEKYIETIKNKTDFMTFTFPNTLSKESKVILLNELKERFPIIYFNNDAYIGPSLQRVKMPIFDANYSEYKIYFKGN